MKTGYAVVEMQYEYDDNRHNSQGYGPPKKVYLDRAKAEAEYERRTRAWFNDVKVSDYAYDIEDAFSEKGKNKLLELLPAIQVQNEIEIENPEDLSFDELAEVLQSLIRTTDWDNIADILNEVLVRPFTVIEVMIEE